jgi:GTP cyclohydrolase II
MGSYTIYRAIAIACGGMANDYKPDFTNTSPVYKIGPYPSWKKIVSLDPWGAEVCSVFREYYEKGIDIRPTIAVTKAHINIPELRDSVAAGRLHVDGKVMLSMDQVRVTKAAADPVWYLPGVSKRLGADESVLRRTLFEQTGGMFPELITRYDLEVFLPPIGGITVYIFGDPDFISDPTKQLAVRVHDECNGSDVFGSDICTCRPYLVHGVETCIKTAQEGGAGVIVYYRKEGRGLGEVVKYLVYNARKRQEGGDTADKYFSRTKCVAGVEDARMQPLMPDILHWLGITKIDKFVSMSDDKYDAVTKAGIKIIERVPIPLELIPPDAHVEINAKIAKGYFTSNAPPTVEDLTKCKGRGFDGVQ